MPELAGRGGLGAGSFLAAICDDARAALLRAGVARRYATNDILLHKGDPSSYVAVITAGWVKVCSTTRGGYESLLAVRGPGDLVGELSALDGKPRSATVLALVPVEASLLPGPRFVEALRAQPPLALALLDHLAGRLREADRRRIEFGSMTVTERLAGRLLGLAEAHGRPEGEGIAIDIPLSQRDLAGAVGASREAVARVLRILRERDVVRTGRQQIVIVRPLVLRSIAGAAD